MARVKAPRVFLSPPFPLDINIDEVGFRPKKGLRTAALHIITETRGRPQIRSVNPKTRIKYFVCLDFWMNCDIRLHCTGLNNNNNNDNNNYKYLNSTKNIMFLSASGYHVMWTKEAGLSSAYSAQSHASCQMFPALCQRNGSWYMFSFSFFPLVVPPSPSHQKNKTTTKSKLSINKFRI